MDWLSYECQQLAFKIKDHMNLDSTFDETYFLNILTQENGNDYTFLAAIHSIIKLLILDHKFTEEYQITVLKILIEFQEQIDQTHLEIFVTKKLQVLILRKFLSHIFGQKHDLEMINLATKFILDQESTILQQHYKDSIMQCLQKQMMVQITQSDNSEIIENIIHQLLIKGNAELNLNLFLYFLNFSKKHNKTHLYENIMKNEIIYYIFNTKHESLLQQNNVYIIFELILNHFTKCRQENQIYILFGQLFQKRALKYKKQLQEKQFKSLEEFKLMLTWFFKLMHSPSLIYQNFILYNQTIIEDFISLIFEMCEFEEVKVLTLKLLLHNIDFTAPSNPNVNSLYFSQQQLKKRTQLFNESPLKCLKEYSETPQYWANFLRFNSYLDPKKMTEILGSQKYTEILEQYLNTFNFKGIEVLDAVRLIFSNFFMFGESQYIERIIDQFTLKLYRDNPGPFEHSDGLYTYVYAIIMLNTDLHNVNMERKITLQQFKKNCEKINNKKNLDDSILDHTYFAIQSREITCLDHRDLVYEESIDKNLYLEISTTQSFTEDQMVFEQEGILLSIFMKQIIKHFSLFTNNFQPQALLKFLQKMVDKINDDDEMNMQLFYILESQEQIQCCYELVCKNLVYLDTEKIIQFVLKTQNFRVQVGDSKTISANFLIERIKKSNKFYEQNIAKKNSIFNIFTDFLEAESSDEELQPKEGNSQYLELFLKQTRFLRDNQLEQLLKILIEKPTQDSLSIYFEIIKQNLSRLEIFKEQFVQLQQIENKLLFSLVQNRLFIISLDLLDQNMSDSFYDNIMKYIHNCSLHFLEELQSYLKNKIHKENEFSIQEFQIILVYLREFLLVYKERNQDMIRKQREKLIEIIIYLSQKVCFYKNIYEPFKILLQFLSNIEHDFTDVNLQMLQITESIVMNLDMNYENIDESIGIFLIQEIKKTLIFDLFDFIVKETCKRKFKFQFILHLIQKFVFKLDFYHLNIDQILLLVNKIKSLYKVQEPQDETQIAFLSFLNKIIIFSLEKPEIEQLWNEYILLMNSPTEEEKEILKTQLQYLEDKSIIERKENVYVWTSSQVEIKVPEIN